MLPGLTFLDAVNLPSGQGTGDDRYGFDESAGTAWVIDGATDVGTRRLFPEIGDDPSAPAFGWESDAAWYADRLSERFMKAPDASQPVPDYLTGVISDLAIAARAEARSDIDQEPRYNIPCASGVWVRRSGNSLDIAILGDCMALIESDGRAEVIGDVDGIREEYARWGETMRTQDRAAGFAKAREMHDCINTPDGPWVFSIHPEAVTKAKIISRRIQAPTRILLMSDGFFRLVEPYRLYTADALITAAFEDDGLFTLVRELRSRESDPGEDAAMGRLKTSDDASALLAEITPEA